VLATVMSVVIVLFGIIGLTYLGVREIPSVDAPIITVSTTYVGANADVIESQITEPLEEAINGIAGIRSIVSTSREGRSTLRVEFELDVPLEAAANDVRDKVAGAISRLPADADPPVVAKSDADASPIIFLNIKSESRSLLELSDIAERTFKERLQTIPGVSEIRIWGQKRYAMRLWMDPAKLAAYGLTPLDVQRALQEQNLELPAGAIEGNTTELTIRTLGRLETPEQFNNMIVKEEENRIVRFRDVGYAELGPENLRTVLKRDNVPMVGNAIIPQPGSNHIEIADEFYRRLEQIKKDLPADIETGIGFDTTRFIRASISEVQQTVYMAFALVVLIIFLFLRDWRTTVIPVVVIPISLIGSFFVMYLAGYSINVLTLLGIVLAIGLVVDDAIVVLENIYTKVEDGMAPLEASLKGINEIFFAVVATTVALVAVFLPIVFLQGLVGRLFQEFGVVLAGAVVISSFVALTLTPMLAARILKKRERQNVFYRKTEPFFEKLTEGYADLLDGFMRHRWLSIPIILGSVAMIFGLGSLIPTELAPLEDRSQLRLIARAQEGATFEYMERFINDVVDLLEKEVPGRESTISVTSPGFGAGTSTNSGFIRLQLVQPEEREITQQQVAERLGKLVSTLSGARVFVRQEPTIGDPFGGQPVQFVIQAPNLDMLKEVIPPFMERARKSEMFGFSDVDLVFNKPEVQVEVLRDKAQAMGVSVQDIAQTMQLAFSGQRFGYFIMDGKQYQVIGQADRPFRNDPSDLRMLQVRNSRGEMIPLDNMVRLTEETTPPMLYRYNRFASATVSATLAKGYTLGQGIAEMERISSEVLIDSYSTALAGESKDFAESSSSLFFAFFLALGLVYLVLAAQFESFRDPLIIMFTVPLAVAGAVLSLWYFEKTLNIFSEIGVIMLVGLVTKNAILIVEFANQRKDSGLSVGEAIRDAAVSRFRPILMTTMSTVLGTLPIALAVGAGAASRTGMGIAIIGGLLFASLLTLFVIPAIYSFVSGEEKRTEVEL
jgi:hydrophobe/amphiphile efflux-1 (HAE1) family protein